MKLPSTPKQATNEEMCASTLAHYERVSSAAHEWNNQVPQAIKAWYAAKDMALRSEPVRMGEEAFSRSGKLWAEPAQPVAIVGPDGRGSATGANAPPPPQPAQEDAARMKAGFDAQVPK